MMDIQTFIKKLKIAEVDVHPIYYSPSIEDAYQTYNLTWWWVRLACELGMNKELHRVARYILNAAPLPTHTSLQAWIYDTPTTQRSKVILRERWLAARIPIIKQSYLINDLLYAVTHELAGQWIEDEYFSGHAWVQAYYRQMMPLQMYLERLEKVE